MDRCGEENAQYGGSSFQRSLIRGRGEKQPMYFDNLNWSRTIYVGSYMYGVNFQKQPMYFGNLNCLRTIYVGSYMYSINFHSSNFFNFVSLLLFHLVF
jgi:hypothetical protein